MNTSYDIHERIYAYVIRVIKFVKILPRTEENRVAIKQILRSVTSMGANDREANGAISKKDFIHKYSIVRKETMETIYWLNVIKDTNVLENGIDDLINEGIEIAKIVSTIVYNTRSKLMNTEN